MERIRERIVVVDMMVNDGHPFPLKNQKGRAGDAAQLIECLLSMHWFSLTSLSKLESVTQALSGGGGAGSRRIETPRSSLDVCS